MAQDLWAAKHVALHDHGLSAPGRELDAAAFCRQCAQDDPQNARFWLAEATTWDAWAQNRDTRWTPPAPVQLDQKCLAAHDDTVF